MHHLPRHVLLASCLLTTAVPPTWAAHPPAAPKEHAPAPAAPAHDEPPHGKGGETNDVTPPVPATAPAHAPAAGVPADEAIRLLADGNARFAANTPARPHQNPARLAETFTGGQHPFAAVLACADSRVPVEIVFDAGIGDLFVVRVAGNVSDTDEIGTLEYGVEHLGINAVLVLGHLKCGAVTAVVDKARVTPNVEKLVDNIVPAAEQARRAFPQLSGARLVEKAIRMNVNRSVADLMARSELIRGRVKDGRLKIVGGVYNLGNGEVDWLEPSIAADLPPARTDNPPAARPAAPHAAIAPEVPTHAAHAPPANEKGHAAPADAHSRATPPQTAAPTTTASAEKPRPAKKENFVALGGLLAAAGVTSAGIFHFAYRRGGKPPAASVPPAAAH